MKVTTNISECGYNIVLDKGKNIIEANNKNIDFSLTISSLNKIDLTLKNNLYPYDTNISNIAFLYTFDPIQTIVKKNNNVNMLIYSILSVYMEMPEATIYLYTSLVDDVNKIFKNFNIKSLLIKQIDDVYLTEGIDNKFAKIGHARIYLIPYLLKTTNKHIIYMDNDTLIRSGGRYAVMNMLKTLEHPIGYISESYMTIYQWLEASSMIKDKKILGEMCRGYGEKNTINNGLLVFPNNKKSLDFSISIEKIYNYYLNKYEYFYGLDMFIFSLMVHKYKYNDQTVVSLLGSKTLIHYYSFKFSFMFEVRDELYKYCKNNLIDI